MTPRRLFQTLARAEAVTWTLLILGLVLKYVTRTTDLGVSIAGPIHGFAFLSFAAATVLVGVNQRWRVPTIALGVVSAVIPYATVAFASGVHRRAMLQGGWRLEARSGERDRLVDRMLRTALARPVLSGALAVVAVAAVFVVLLILGPPGR